MNIEKNKVIEKIAELKCKPVQLFGYTMDDKEGDSRMRLYPELDPSFYYLFNKDCILAKLDGDEKSDKVTLLLDPECEIECVSKWTANTELGASGQYGKLCGVRVCHESEGNFCDEIVIIAMVRSPYQARILQLAKHFAEKGRKLNCNTGNPARIGCCRLFNRLIDLILLPDSNKDKEGDINTMLDAIERTCKLS